MVWHLKLELYLYFIQMKNLHNNFGWVLGILIIASACGSSSPAQTSEQDIRSLIESKRFVFNAQTATPLGGRVVQLTSGYDLRVRPDSVVSYLPYYGRAFSAPIDPSRGGIQFTSTDFEYSQTPRRKGWDITITPRDVQDTRQLTLNVSSGGNATLQVISNNRQAISFNGYISGASR